jgi:serine/threonine protein kinase
MLTHTDDLVGMRVGSCTLERLLGLGGMSAVYLARQERPRRQVAVKLLRATHAPDQDGWQRTLARFHREADAAAALDHANIVPIYAFGVEDTGAGEIAYIVMPYLADGSLGALLARRGPLDVPEALVYLEQAGAALDYAHQAGIVHRDVKPSNLLLHPDGRLLLADFGVARALRGALDANLSTSGMTVGTPEYMAPEQIRGEIVGPAADVYALGVVAYTLLGGHTPFEAPALARVGASADGGEQREMRALLERQVNEPPPPVRMQRAGLSPRLEEAIFWALAKDPSDRPPTAGAFVRAARDGSRSRVMTAFFSMTGGRADGLLASGFAASLPRFAAATIPPLAFARGPDRLGDFGDFGDSGATVPGPDTPTIHDLPLLGERPAPEWPSPARTRGPNKRPPFSPTKLLLITAGVLLGCALMVGGVGALAYLLQGVSPVAGPSSTATGTSQPTMTPEPTATAMPSIILAASPTDVTLACRVGKGSQATITLSNRGQDTAQWSASQDGPQIAVNPPAGTISPGKRQTITLSRSSFTARDSQGTLRFSADGAADSASATVSYTVQGCLRASGDNGQAFQPLGAHVIGNGGKHGRKRED